MPAYITALGVCLPNKPVPNTKIESILGMIGKTPSTARDIILGRNGIKWRYYAIDPDTGKPTHTNAQLTVQAICALADAAGLDLRDIQLLACGTSSPDQAIPGHAAMVHGLLKCPPCEIVSTAGVCCSGMAAMKYAYASIQAGLTASAIVTGSESASSALNASQFYVPPSGNVEENPYLGFSQEFLRFMLSDGAGAVLVEDQPRREGTALRIDWMEIFSFANEVPACMYTGAVKQPDGSLRGWREEEEGIKGVLHKGYFNLSQDVSLLGEHIVKLAVRAVNMVRQRRRLEADQIDWHLPHLSSLFFQQPIYDALVAEDFGIPLEKWFTNLKYKGNTGSASIFIMLEELVKSGKLKKGDRVLCAVPESARFTFAFMHLTVQ